MERCLQAKGINAASVEEVVWLWTTLISVMHLKQNGATSVAKKCMWHIAINHVRRVAVRDGFLVIEKFNKSS